MSKTRPVFTDYQQRILPLVLLAAFGSLPLCLLLTAPLTPFLGPLAGLAGFALWAWLLLDRVVLLGNRGLRSRLAARLRGFGRTVDDGRDRFVGLAWPCHLNDSSRRMVETDDDVGFLRVTADGVSFFGDGSEFHVAAENIADVRLARHGSAMAFWRRVEIDTRDGEPMERIVLDSRNHGSHGACRRDNRRLYEEIRRLLVADAEQVRLAAEIDDQVLESEWRG